MCCLVSVVAMAAVIIVLELYNGKSLSEWRYPITFNTLVAVFSTVSNASAMIAVQECLGQLKWIWFAQDSRKLADFSVFDSASRGLWASLLILGKARRAYDPGKKEEHD